MQEQDFIQSGLRTITIERDAVTGLLNDIDQQFAQACQILLRCQGRIVVTGMGKSGHIGKKIAATLASTGSPAFFVHPAEASHGDMGMITANDVVLALSNSGNTAEVVTLLPLIKRLHIPLVSMTGNPDSVLAEAAAVNLNASVSSEACPLDLAPTASTTVALVLGDALAIALLEARGFSAEDFAFSHPGGTLGRKLLLKVEDIMHQGDAVPIVSDGVKVEAALLEMTDKKLGMTCIVDNQKKLSGIFTDGDLRRALKRDIAIRQTPITDVMTANGKTIQKDRLAAEALAVMEDNQINALVVVDEQQCPIGALNMHDLLKAGVV